MANDRKENDALGLAELHLHQEDSHLNAPVEILLVRSLHLCAIQKDLLEGARLHASIIKAAWHERNVFIGSALVNAYAKCIALGKAQLVLDDLPSRNVVCWNGLIAGYAQNGFETKAFSCYVRMKQEGVSPDEVTYSSVLKACCSISTAENGKAVHAELLWKGFLEQDIVIGNALIDFYINFHALEKAHQVFEELPTRDVISWTALITGCCDHGHYEKALNYFKQMKEDELYPDATTFSAVLKACGRGELLEEGRKVHAEMTRSGLCSVEIVLGNSLLDMYAKCGALENAKVVFQELHKRDLVSWNVLLGGYSEHGFCEDVLRYFEFMIHDAFCPDEITYICILKACRNKAAVEEGRKIHAKVLKQGYLGKHVNLGNALVDMYAKCGALARAQQVFMDLQVQNVISWTALISGLCKHGHSEHALNCFEELKGSGALLDVVGVAGLLKACSRIGALDWGKELHARIFQNGLLENEVVGNALLDMYVRCGLLAKAQQVFDELPTRTLLSWNSLCIGYNQHGYEERTIHFYEHMENEGVDPNEVTLSCILKACGSKKAAKKGQALHAEIARKGFLEEGTVLGNALLDMYMKCGLVVLAKQVFEELPCSNLVSWNVLITGYCQHDLNEKAIDCFDHMEHKGMVPDAVTFALALKACGNIGAAKKGTQIHADLARKAIFTTDLVVGSALVGMYAKCGAFSRAKEVFEKLPTQDAVSWTALIGGYCENGLSEEALRSFELMRHSGHTPDVITFACILKACGTVGAIDKGEMYFESIRRRHGMSPSIEHHTSMLLLHCCAGHFDEAMSQMRKLPQIHQRYGWIALLGACKKWGNFKLGRFAFENWATEVCIRCCS